jgi:hypothetical protein
LEAMFYLMPKRRISKFSNLYDTINYHTSWQGLFVLAELG